MTKKTTPQTLESLPALLAIQSRRGEIQAQLDRITDALEAAEADLDASTHVDAERLQTLRAEKAALLADAAIRSASRVKGTRGPAEPPEGLPALEAAIEEEAAKVNAARKQAKEIESRAKDTLTGLERKREALLADIEALTPEHDELLAKVLSEYVNHLAADYIARADAFREAFRLLHGIQRMYFLRGTPAGAVLDKVFAPLSGKPVAIPEPHPSLPAVTAFRARRFGPTHPAWATGCFDHPGTMGPHWEDIGGRTATEHLAVLKDLGVEMGG